MATLADIYTELRSACEAAGGQAAWAQAHGVSPAYVNDVLMARHDPGPKILAAMGYVKVISYQRRNKE